MTIKIKTQGAYEFIEKHGFEPLKEFKDEKAKGIMVDVDEAILPRSVAKLYVVAGLIHKILEKHKVTVRGMSGERLIFTDEETGEEYVVQDLGYPI